MSNAPDLFDDVVRRDIAAMLGDLASRVANQKRAVHDREQREDLDEYGARIIAASAYMIKNLL